MDVGSQEHRQDGDLVHVAVTSLKGRAFRTEKKNPDGLREPSDERDKQEKQEEMPSLGQVLNVFLKM